ncbi:MAG: hypothetical protein EXX96DRAFT_638175 [Benjaminiella poitrasii]|nr:MAG: hypothetical protein EXX96DRAFT_638175 [Benjaminiella poitrasii]
MNTVNMRIDICMRNNINFTFPELLEDIEDSKPNESNNKLFRNLVRSVSFAADFLFHKRKIQTENSALINSDLYLEEEINKINSEYKSVFTAVTGSDSREVKRCSVKEYYHLTGSTKYSAKLQRLKDKHSITDIESHISSNRTSSLA